MDAELVDCQQTRPCDIIYHNLLCLLTDLRKDLDIIAVEVNSYKDVELGDGSDKSEENNKFLEQVIQSLLAQNDHLQEALDKTLKEQHDTTTLHAETNNQTLKCQIDNYKSTLCQKEKQITELTLLLSDISTQVETVNRTEREVKDLRRKSRKQLEDALNRSANLQQQLDKCKENEQRYLNQNMELQIDLTECKQQNERLASKLWRIKEIMAVQESNLVDIGKKFKKLETSCEILKGQLQNANKTITTLQSENEMLEKRYIEAKSIRLIQSNETFKLKQQMGALLGRQRSLEQQLTNSLKEIEAFKAHCHKQHVELQERDNAYKKEDSRAKQYISELKKKLERLVADYNEMEAAYKEEHRIRMISESMVETYRKWKEQQLTNDEEFKARMKNYVEHIQLLVYDKKHVQERCRELYMENDLLRRELERLIKECQTNSSFTENHMFAQRLKLIRATSLRITQQLTRIPLRPRSDHQSNNVQVAEKQA